MKLYRMLIKLNLINKIGYINFFNISKENYYY